ncbi:hypothetical protein M752DRAFT_285847 [Aspergillus phoenicis ATCC 13157]|uniref:F-box domain-containing protein n=1 Tax=Aspergillus phoenicis ATCC 13157 TaxID=1353007 RepID=A0A370PA16_ASPPH|nr:hypothetical protein M752DRAFT_285847 [Aspergillus phoenicis ATCC 13157]
MDEVSCQLGTLPREILWRCTHYLDPLSVVQLSSTCKDLKALLRERYSWAAFQHATTELKYYVKSWISLCPQLSGNPRPTGDICRLATPEDAPTIAIHTLPRIQAVVLNNRRSILEAYIDAGIDPDEIVVGRGWGSLLLIAAISNNTEMVEFLFEKGAKPRRSYMWLPSESSILDEVAWCNVHEKPAEIWEKTALSFLERGVIFSSLHMAKELGRMPNAPHLLEVALRNGLDIHRTWESRSLLHIAARRNTPHLMKTILSHAPEQVNIHEIVRTVGGYIERQQSALDIAISEGKTKNVGFLLGMGSKPTFYSLEVAIRISDKSVFYGDGIEEVADITDWFAWKLQWVDYVHIIASKLDLDSEEAALPLERILHSAWGSAQQGNEEDGRLYLSVLFRKMSLRTRLLYAGLIAFEAYEDSLTAAKKNIEDLEERFYQLKSQWWQVWRCKVSGDRSINHEKLEDIRNNVEELDIENEARVFEYVLENVEKRLENAGKRLEYVLEYVGKKLEYVKRQVKGLEDILELRNEATLDSP